MKTASMRLLAVWLVAAGVTAGQEPERIRAEQERALAVQARAEAEALAQLLIARAQDVRGQVEQVRQQVDQTRAQAERMRAEGGRQTEEYYRAGRRQLDEGRWDRAVENFSAVARLGGSRADASLYWKAYAQHKLGQRTEALATLAEMQKAHPSSRWSHDAKALEVEVRQSSGQPVSPESETDEDIKLMAINSLVNTDPERALPLLDKLFRTGQSPRIKERALFILSRTDSARAREIVTQVARGGANPELQMRALEHIGSIGGVENRQILVEVYSSTSDPGLKRAILRGYRHAGDKERLLAAAREEKIPEVRREAIQQLGSLDAHAELWQLYTAEPTVEYKLHILRANFDEPSLEKLAEVARTEKDPKLRAEAARILGHRPAKQTGEILASLYAADSDRSVRRAVLDGMQSQNNATALIAIARKETDASLKKEAVNRLSHMRSKEATDFLMEILSK